MSIINRITTWTIGQVLKAADLNGEFNNITNLFNNLDAATTSWTNVKVGTLNVTTKATVPNGSASTDAAAFGQIFYGFQAAVQVVDTASSGSSGTTYTSTTTTASITPTSASHRIRISVSGAITNGVNGVNGNISLFRGASDLSNGGNGFALISGTTAGNSAPCSISYIDSPATTSATTYTVKIKIASGSMTWNVLTGSATIILEEIV